MRRESSIYHEEGPPTLSSCSIRRKGKKCLAAYGEKLFPSFLVGGSSHDRSIGFTPTGLWGKTKQLSFHRPFLPAPSVAAMSEFSLNPQSMHMQSHALTVFG